MLLAASDIARFNMEPLHVSWTPPTLRNRELPCRDCPCRWFLQGRQSRWYPGSVGRLVYKESHLVVLSVFTAFQRLVFISGQFIYYLASTFKPNGSSSSTDYNQEKRNYKVLKSESDFVEAFISSPKRFISPSTRPI